MASTLLSRQGSETSKKLVAHIKEDPYESRLKALQLSSLEFSRKHGDMIFNGIYQIEPDIFFWLAEDHGTTYKRP